MDYIVWKIGYNLNIHAYMLTVSGRFICQSEPNVLRWNQQSRIDWIWNKESKTCILRVDHKVVAKVRTYLENTDLRPGARFAGGKWYMVVQHGRGNE